MFKTTIIFGCIINRFGTCKLKISLAVLAIAILAILAEHTHRFDQLVKQGNPTLSGFAKITNGGYVANDGVGNEHLYSSLIAIEPHKNYRINFNLIRTATEPVLVQIGLYNTGYDNVEQRRIFTADISTIGQSKQLLINTGDSPSVAAVRILYYGSPGLEFDGLSVSLVPIWLVWLPKFGWLMVLVILLVNGIVIVRGFLHPPPSSLDRNPPNSHIQIDITLGLCYIGSVLVHFSLSLFLPYWGGDEYVYRSIAGGIWNFGKYGILDSNMVGQVVDFPNLVYPYLIAPTFALGAEFYSAIRLVNALIMSAAIFPAYWVSKEFVSRRWALFCAVVTVSLPFVNLGAFAVTEVLFYPLFLFSFWIAYRCITSPSVYLYIGYGALIALMLNVRLNALVLFPAFMLASLITEYRQNRACQFFKRPLWLLSAISTTLSYVVLQYISNVKNIGGLGFYSFVAHDTGLFDLITTQFFSIVHLLGGHIATLALPYALPLAYLIAALCSNKRECVPLRTTTALFALTLCFFAALLALSIVFTMNISSMDVGGLQRWHSRYYFYIYPMLILLSLIFINQTRSTLYFKWIPALVLLQLMIGLVFIFELAPEDRWFGYILDNADTSWYRVIAPWYLIGVATTVGLLGLWRFNSNWFSTAFVVFLLAHLAIANIGWLSLADFANTQRDANCGRLVIQFLNQHPGRIGIIATSREKLVDAAFWIPHPPVFAGFSTSTVDTVSADTLQGGADYLVVNGSREVGGEFKSVLAIGQCHIYAFPKVYPLLPENVSG